jgi:hypothetical protein
LYERFGRALQSEYVITYTSPASLRDGVNRALSVNLGSGAGGAAAPVSYNPGGLVPEVAEPAAWPLFAGLVMGLVLLLFAPRLIGRFVRRSPAAAEPAAPAPGRVKLEAAAPAAQKKPRSGGGSVKLKG